MCVSAYIYAFVHIYVYIYIYNIVHVVSPKSSDIRVSHTYIHIGHTRHIPIPNGLVKGGGTSKHVLNYGR